MYVFLLRLPSEALPIARGGDGFEGHGEQAVIYFADQHICLKLGRRKNKPAGSLLRRSCWCSSCPDICPIHILWAYYANMPAGWKPFHSITPKAALSVLRGMLSKLEISDAELYRTHDLRRGHAKDLQMSGASLAEFLAAGEWRSPAYMKYTDLNELEYGVVMQAHVEDSSSEEKE